MCSAFAMNRPVALHAECDAIRGLVTQFGERRPRLDVVRVKVSAAYAALLAGVAVALEDRCAPLLVFVSTPRNLTLVLVAGVSRVSLTALEVSSRTPFRAIGSASYRIFPCLSLFRIAHLLQCLTAATCAPLGGMSIGVHGGNSTRPRSLCLFTDTKRCAEVALPLRRIMSAATRAVRRYVVMCGAPFELRPRHIEAVAANGAGQVNAGRHMLRVGACESLCAHGLVLALTRTRLTASVLQATGRNIEPRTADGADALDATDANRLFGKAELGILWVHRMLTPSGAVPSAVTAARRRFRASIIPSPAPFRVTYGVKR